MEKTKIEWCKSTWNPVTGCLHNCKYCYARGIARRFGGIKIGNTHGNLCILDEPYRADDSRINPYPYEFMPTFHRYRLNDYIDKSGRTIFVCSMADLFGKWVPDEWIIEVFEACKAAPQHNYLFLTKNPGRYIELINKGLLPGTDNMWYGYSATQKKSAEWWNPMYNIFASVEPILEPMDAPRCKWCIIGAETGRRKDKVVPERNWIEDIVNRCREWGTPVFMKPSLADIWKEPLIQEFPVKLEGDK